MLKSHKRIFHAACLDCSPIHCRSRIIIFSELHSRATATMHLAKGLEFRGVVVMACDDDVARIEEVSDESDLEEVYNTECHLLYVACTRARDRLFVSGVAPDSELLADLSERAPLLLRTQRRRAH